jgi:hypothetical protein
MTRQASAPFVGVNNLPTGRKRKGHCTHFEELLSHLLFFSKELFIVTGAGYRRV